MKKRLVGSALLASTLMIGLHPSLNKTNNIQKSEYETIPFGQIQVTLVEAIDGDTIKVMINEKVETVRYLLIDTPETKKPGMCVQPYAEEASKRNKRLLRNRKLTLEFEQGVQRDVYGRLLAYVYADGQSVQESLLKEGFARVAYIMNPPYKYLSIYENDETFAKRNKEKIWSTPNYVSNRGFNGCVE